jgi:phosphoglycolate phosphatase
VKLLIFDLDGTLIDSGRDIAISTNAMLRELGRPEVDEKTVNSYVGNGVGVLVRRALGESSPESEFEAGVAFFIRYYRAHSLEHTRLYPGMRAALDELKNSDHKLAVLTNKPVKISCDILQGLGVADYFFRIYGGDSFETKKPNPLGIIRLMEEAGAKPDETTMIGDSDVDILTANNAGVQACGVCWGLKPESLSDPCPDLLVDSPNQLTAKLCGVMPRHP